MHSQETRDAATTMRKQGASISKITKALGISRGSASEWLRGVVLDASQAENLKKLQVEGSLAGSRAAGISNGFSMAQRDKEARHFATELWEHKKQDSDFIFALALYVGEGGKAQRSSVDITNCDFRVLLKASSFFQSLGMDISRFKLRIQVHDGRSVQNAIAYWSGILGVPASSISALLKKAGSLRKNQHPYGICTIRIHDTRMHVVIKHLMDLALSPTAD